jgi:hypothetical protein
MKFEVSKLFHAVVISGAALTSSGVAQESSVSTTTDALTKPEATNTTLAAPPICPPGSERPYPPCYWIK